MPATTVFSPAKINLFLAVTGRRPDGFHDLVSIVAPLAFGDTLSIELMERDGPVTLACDDLAVPTGEDNLAVRAAEAWRRATGTRRAIHLVLEKRIPMGAGLGGGSSNAAAVLRGLNESVPQPLDEAALMQLAAGLGSDCSLFLAGEPCLMRGRGERLELLGPSARRRLSGRRVLVFKPDFPISTPWAYGQLVAMNGTGYTPAEQAEAMLAEWIGGDVGAGAILFNSFERVAFAKFQALPVLVEALRAEPGVEGVAMSGSGSACFALLSDKADGARLRERVSDAWGATALVFETVIR